MKMQSNKVAVMSTAAGLLVAIGLFIIFSTSNAPPADAALYWFHGVRSNPISVCFVGDAVTSRPDRVQQILTYIKEFEYAANVQFDYWGTCPAPTTQPGGDDYHDGDIRVVISSISVSGTGPVPGNGCPMFNQQGPGGYNGDNDGWGSWSNAPDDLATNRPCLYNLKLGDDPWNDTPYLNHTLHEFGHALGLSHEHQRLDSPCYDPNNDTRVAGSGYMTPYDYDSVMNYKFSTSAGHTCDINGNYDNTGLSTWDKLGLHILYPEENLVAEFVGTTVIRTGDTLSLQSAWKARGANMDFVASNFAWKLNGETYSTTPDLVTTLSTAGDYALELTHDDFLGRSYSYTGVVRVLESEAFDEQIAGPVAASLPLLYPNYFILTFGGTVEPALGTIITVISDTFTDTIVIDYSPQPASDTGGLSDVGLFYDLQATYLSSGQPAQLQPGQTYSISVTYQQEDVLPGVNEAHLALYSWDGGQWVKEETSVVDTEANTVAATPGHFSLWVVLSEWYVYLPMVLK